MVEKAVAIKDVNLSVCVGVKCAILYLVRLYISVEKSNGKTEKTKNGFT